MIITDAFLHNRRQFNNEFVVRDKSKKAAALRVRLLYTFFDKLYQYKKATFITNAAFFVLSILCSDFIACLFYTLDYDTVINIFCIAYGKLFLFQVNTA